LIEEGIAEGQAVVEDGPLDLNLSQSLLPITRPTLHVHHGNNQDTVGLINVKQSVGKNVREVPANRRIEQTETNRLPTHLADQPLNLVVETSPQLRMDAGAAWVYSWSASG
jgi:hypothetical protein